MVGERGVRRVLLHSDEPPVSVDTLFAPLEPQETAAALSELIDGTRRDFPYPLDWEQGTEFQRRVWRELLTIPWGETVTYGELARRLGLPVGASRAVGQANGANPLPVIIPCHRVVAADHRLGGYAGGLDLKRRLLAREGVVLP
jgi:methylated-DNA-[protein]-cysteine S-methyltransferase